MPWNSREFYKNVKHGIFINSDVPAGKRSYQRRLAQLTDKKRTVAKKLIGLLGPTTTNASFNKYLLNCKQVPTANTSEKVRRCGTFICPFCFYRRLYVFFRGRLHRAIKAKAAKYIGITRTQTFMLCPTEEAGLVGTRLFDPIFIPVVQTRADAERMAARLFTEAEMNRRYEQAWFENDAVNCQAAEPLGGFSTTWFDYQPTRNVFVLHRLALHLTNTNALSPPTSQALNTWTTFDWHFAAEFDPCFVFDNFVSFPYGLYSALSQPNRTEFGPAHVVAYLFGMRRLLERKFKFQQTWGCLRD